jgi:hypothetical protein
MRIQSLSNLIKLKIPTEYISEDEYLVRDGMLESRDTRLHPLSRKKEMPHDVDDVV